MRQPNEMITSRIPRQELIGLLETMSPYAEQRVTAEHDVVDVAAIIASLPAELDIIQHSSSLELTVRFSPTSGIQPVCTQPTPDRRPLPQWAIVMAACMTALLLLGLTMAVA